MKAIPEQPPERQRPPGQRTRYQPAIDTAKASPGKWFRLEGEHHSGNITTLKGHGLAVKSRRSTDDPNKHFLWIAYNPDPKDLLPKPDRTPVRAKKVS